MKIFTKTVMILALIATGAHANPNDDDNSNNNNAKKTMQEVFGGDAMPADVFKEILAYLSPNDIYALSRAGKFQSNKDDSKSTLSGYLQSIRIPAQRKAMEEILKTLELPLDKENKDLIEKELKNNTAYNFIRSVIKCLPLKTTKTLKTQNTQFAFINLFTLVPNEHLALNKIMKVMPLCLPSIPKKGHNVFMRNQVISRLIQYGDTLSKHVKAENLMEFYGYLLPFIKMCILIGSNDKNRIDIIQEFAQKNDWKTGIFDVFKKAYEVSQILDKNITLNTKDGLFMHDLLAVTQYNLIKNVDNKKLSEIIQSLWNRDSKFFEETKRIFEEELKK